MDKLREQIAKIICRSKCLAHNDNCQCSTGAADAILALLQPRMLTKDEANYIQSHLKSNSSCPPWKCGFYDCRRIKDLVLAKLKRIQEAK